MQGECRERLVKLRAFLKDYCSSPFARIAKSMVLAGLEPLEPDSAGEAESEEYKEKMKQYMAIKEQLENDSECRFFASRFLGIGTECLGDNAPKDPAKCKECVQQLDAAVEILLKKLAITVAGALALAVLIQLRPVFCELFSDVKELLEEIGEESEEIEEVEE